ncbi:MAG TPA: VOC family protein [Thermoanaerobaculia bacterium]|nr:VOC family protein [Thermoanaerobaculia bacterium]
MIRSLVPFIHVRDVLASIAFYEKLGFKVDNTYTPPDEDTPVWAWLQINDAELMLGVAEEPVVPEQQAIFFYVYADDVSATHAELRAAGIEVGEITHAFYAPRGEFRVIDPDGYSLMITHYGQ